MNETKPTSDQGEKSQQLGNSKKQELLNAENQAAFRDGEGLFRSSEVAASRYDGSYYSNKHVAYKERGYSLEERREKYADALENIARVLPGKILDIGCGPGHFVAILNGPPYSKEVFGVDYSAVATQELSTPEARPFIAQGSATDLPYADGAFDSAYSFHTLEHLTEDQVRQAIAEISRVVSSKLYLIIPTWGDAILSDPDLFSQIIDDPTHRVIATREWWLKEFEKFGWKSNDVEADSFDRLKRGWVFVLERQS